jgi:hypothetical protein
LAQQVEVNLAGLGMAGFIGHGIKNAEPGLTGLVDQELGQQTRWPAGGTLVITPYPGRAGTINMGPSLVRGKS